MSTVDTTFNVSGGLMPVSTASTPSDTIDQEGFLSLLIAQIQNQDPLEPMDNEEFVSQLTSFSSLDELREINEGMAGLGELEDISQILAANLALQQAALNASTVGLIGNEVEAISDTVTVGAEGTEIGFAIPDGGATSVTVSLVGNSDNVLYSLQFNPTNPPEGVRVVGDRVYVTVPTTTQDGTPIPEGSAGILVQAETPGGVEELTTTLLGPVDGLDFRNETTMITIAGTPVDLVNVLAVNRI
jgi:flagellar basal-body rod modification protein FlgD